MCVRDGTNKLKQISVDSGLLHVCVCVCSLRFGFRSFGLGFGLFVTFDSCAADDTAHGESRNIPTSAHTHTSSSHKDGLQNRTGLNPWANLMS